MQNKNATYKNNTAVPEIVRGDIPPVA